MKSIIPTSPTGAQKNRREALIGDEARHLWTRLTPARQPGRPFRVAFCSTSSGEGTTSVAANFAICLGQLQIPTCLVEANFRSPTLGRHFGISEQCGLGEALSGERDARDAVTEVAPNLGLVPAGRPPHDYYSALSNGAIRSVLAHTEEGFDVLVVDCPPVGTPEAGLLLQSVDAVVLVVQANRTKKRAVARTLATFRELDVTYYGAVLNQMAYDLPVFIDRML